jgi:hypothetical protein
MRMVRGRGDARWLPSRHNLAIFRLGAYLRGRTAKPEPAEVILFVDRFQSAFENFSLAILTLLTATCYIAATLFRTWPIAGALAVAFPIAVIAVHLPFFILAPLVVSLAPETQLRTQSVGMMLMCLAVSTWFATSESWARFAAWPVLALAGVNAIAAVILVLMRDRIAQFESSFGGSASAL